MVGWRRPSNGGVAVPPSSHEFDGFGGTSASHPGVAKVTSPRGSRSRLSPTLDGIFARSVDRLPPDRLPESLTLGELASLQPHEPGLRSVGPARPQHLSPSSRSPAALRCSSAPLLRSTLAPHGATPGMNGTSLLSGTNASRDPSAPPTRASPQPQNSVAGVSTQASLFLREAEPQPLPATDQTKDSAQMSSLAKVGLVPSMQGVNATDVNSSSPACLHLCACASASGPAVRTGSGNDESSDQDAMEVASVSTAQVRARSPRPALATSALPSLLTANRNLSNKPQPSPAFQPLPSPLTPAPDL